MLQHGAAQHAGRRPLAPEPAGLACSSSSGSSSRRRTAAANWRRPALVVDLAALESVASAVQAGVEQIASASPAALQPAVRLIGGDVASTLGLSPTLPGLARLSVSVWWAARDCAAIAGQRPARAPATALPQRVARMESLSTR